MTRQLRTHLEQHHDDGEQEDHAEEQLGERVDLHVEQPDLHLRLGGVHGAAGLVARVDDQAQRLPRRHHRVRPQRVLDVQRRAAASAVTL